MTDLTKEPYAKWLEDALRSLAEQHPKKIAMVALDAEGNYLSTYYKCGPIDLYTMSGALHAEGIWREIRANGAVLREIIENTETGESE